MFNMSQKTWRPPEPPEPKTSVSRVLWIVLELAALVWLGHLFFTWWSDPTSRDRAADTISSIVRPAVTVANERIQLGEGMSKYYPFELTSTSRVRVQVSASPRDFNVMLMNGGQLEAFEQSASRNPILGPLGNEYTYTASPLSGLKILSMDQSTFLQAGSWAIVVLRPREDLPPFGVDSAAQVNVTIY